MRRFRAFRGRSRARKATMHWHGWEFFTTLTTSATFAAQQVMTTSDYEVSANLQPQGLLHRVVGNLTLRMPAGTATTAVGYWGIIAADSDLAVTNAQFDLSPDSMTDENWLHVGVWGTSLVTQPGGGPAVQCIPFDLKSKRKLRDMALVMCVTCELLSGTPAEVDVLAQGRALLSKVG